MKEGKLVCGSCGHEYKIKEGIANFLLPNHLGGFYHSVATAKPQPENSDEFRGLDADRAIITV